MPILPVVQNKILQGSAKPLYDRSFLRGSVASCAMASIKVLSRTDVDDDKALQKCKLFGVYFDKSLHYYVK